MSAMSEIATELVINWSPADDMGQRFHASGKWKIVASTNQTWLYHWDGSGWALVIASELHTIVDYVSRVEPRPSQVA